VNASIDFNQAVTEKTISYPCGSEYKALRTQINQEIATVAIDGHITQDLLITHSSDQYISLCFILSGKITSFKQDGSVDSVYSQGEGFLISHENFNGSTILHGTDKLSVFSIFMPFDFLARIFKCTSKKRMLQLLNQQRCEKFFQKEILVTPQVKSILHQMDQGKPTEELKCFFVASKVYELINHCFEQLTNNVQQVCTLSANDIVCLKRARKILSENIAEPPSIMQLARTVGINDCKLKRGFKQIFNITPFGYVQELRMMQAKQSLLNGLSSVTSVANQVGYTNVGHFSAAFRKYHGSTPGNFKKNLMIMTA
jgi:AraC family transcriptional activator of pyochelin receptor